MISIISIAIIIGIFLFLDLILAKKTAGYFIRTLSFILLTFTPAVLQNLLKYNMFDESLWFKYFYVTFALTLFISFALSYLYISRCLLKKLGLQHRHFTIFDFLYMGYISFKSDIINKIDESKKNIDENLYLMVHRNLNNDISDFIFTIYALANDEEQNLNLNEFITYVMFRFIAVFFSEHDARFTFRVIDDEKKNMITEITTRTDKVPSPIPIKSKNMIVASMKQDKPLIYSKNIEFHYDTGNSLKKGVYDDYVTYCLSTTKSKYGKEIPEFSINLDIKGLQAINRMIVLVESSIYKIVCDSIALKILSLERREERDRPSEITN